MILRTFVCLSLLLLVASIAKAQSAPWYYNFVEVVDFDQKPIQGATIRRSGKIRSPGKRVHSTDEKGNSKLLVHYQQKRFLQFSVIKSGYFKYELIPFSNINSRTSRSTRVSLIPNYGSTEEMLVNLREQYKRDVFYAAYVGDLEKLENLTRRDANLRSNDLVKMPVKEGIPLLIYGALSNQPDVVKLLVQRGAWIEKNQKVPLLSEYLAIGLEENYTADRYADMRRKRSRRHEIVRILARNGLDLDQKSIGQAPPLIRAAWEGDVGLVKVLAEEGADVTATSVRGWNAAMVVVFKPPFGGRKNALREIFKVGVDPDQYVLKDGPEKCYTAMHFVIRRGDLDLLKFFVEQGADLRKPSCLKKSEANLGDELLKFSLAYLKRGPKEMAAIVAYLQEKGARLGRASTGAETSTK